MEGSESSVSAHDVMVASPTKTGFAGQARGNWRLWPQVVLTCLVLAGALSACSGQVAEGKDCPAALRAKSVSGFCVPRYVSLKRGEVFGRKGPGKDYPAVWIYHTRSLPVQVVAETSEWRRICDPDGGAVWVNRAMIDGRRTVVALGASTVSLAQAPRAGAKIVGQLEPRAVATLGVCRAGWCQVKAGGVSGWSLATHFWGVAEAAQCH